MTTFEEYEKRRKIMEHLEDALSDVRMALNMAGTNYKKEEIEQIYKEIDELARKIYEENFKPDE